MPRCGPTSTWSPKPLTALSTATTSSTYTPTMWWSNTSSRSRTTRAGSSGARHWPSCTPYGQSIVQSGSSDVHRYHDAEQSVVILEYTIHGTVVRTGVPYLNRFISVITVKDRKIVQWRDYLDPLAVFAAFGTTPAPG